MHGPIKEVVGERFAYIALAQTYGMKGFEYTGPIYKSMEIKRTKSEYSLTMQPRG